jgi:hypothetical protein
MSGTAGTSNVLTINRSSSLTSILSGLTVTGTITGDSGTWNTGGVDIATGDAYEINGTSVLSASTLGSSVLASSLTSVGTLSTLSVDNITINGNDISSTAGTDLTITPLTGQQIVLDGAIVIDAGVVTGISSLTIDAAGTLVLPFSATCDSNADGEICEDTSDNQLIVDGSVVQTQGIKIWGVTVASTSPAFLASGLLPVPTQLDGYTITRIQCHVTSGTSKVVAVEDASANASEDITCATTNTTDDGTITNAAYTASELSYIDFGATTGTVDYVTISVFGIWTRD